MLQELIEFTRRLEQDGIRLSDYATPPEGLHFLLHYDANEGAISVVQEELIRIPKKTGVVEVGDVTRAEILPRAMHINPVDSNKSISDKKIQSASPFAFRLKKQSLEDKKWMADDFATQVPRYFREAVRKCKVELTEEQQMVVDAFITFCNVLPDFLAENKNYAALKPGDNIIFYLDNFSLEEYRLANGRYQGDSLFNKNDYNVEADDGQVYGLSGFYNGDNQKKPYLQHQTASFSIGSRISQEEAQLLKQFDLLRQAKAFSTRPLPVFIDEPELNEVAVRTIREVGAEAGFHALMRKLAEGRNADIGNYYLFYILAGKLLDVDFIPAFRYETDAVIYPLFTPEIEGGKVEEGEAKVLRVKTIFDLEKTLLIPLFRNQLVTQMGPDMPLRYRYFDDLDFDPKYQTPALYEMLIRYRKPWYDYIYKSRVSAVSREMFHQIVREGILDDLRHDEWNSEKRFHTRETDICKKLNRWFSLWNYFKPLTPLSNSTVTDMPEKITALRQRMRDITQSETEADTTLRSDEEFAFAAGQVIDYLFSRSKADTPSHAMLEPFLQKTSATQFKEALGRTFQMYMHDIDRFKGKSRFDTLMAAVLGYDYSGNMKDLMPMLLAGYFSKSAIYEKKAEAAKEEVPA